MVAPRKMKFETKKMKKENPQAPNKNFAFMEGVSYETQVSK